MILKRTPEIASKLDELEAVYQKIHNKIKMSPAIDQTTGQLSPQWVVQEFAKLHGMLINLRYVSLIHTLELNALSEMTQEQEMSAEIERGLIADMDDLISDLNSKHVEANKKKIATPKGLVLP